MIIFLYGGDTYRSRQKLHEIINQYKKNNPKGLSLKYFDFIKDGYNDFENEIRALPMFKEKKLLVLKNAGFNENFKKSFSKNAEKFLELKDVIVFFEEEISEKDKFFIFLKKFGKYQFFRPLEGEKLKDWVKKEFQKEKTDIKPEALRKIVNDTGNDLWRLSGEIKKLGSYKRGRSSAIITIKDVELLVRPGIEVDIFKTIDAISLKNKKQALSLLSHHLEKGDSPLYLLSMISFQFRNILLVKSQDGTRMALTGELSRALGMHPYVVKKSLYQAKNFSFEELKEIYQKIFQTDLNIKTGKIDPASALDMLVAEI